MYRKMFIRDCDACDNVVNPNTHEERWKLWCRCIESSKGVDGKVNWKFVEIKMFGSYYNSFSNSNS